MSSISLGHSTGINIHDILGALLANFSLQFRENEDHQIKLHQMLYDLANYFSTQNLTLSDLSMNFSALALRAFNEVKIPNGKLKKSQPDIYDLKLAHEGAFVLLLTHYPGCQQVVNPKMRFDTPSFLEEYKDLIDFLNVSEQELQILTRFRYFVVLVQLLIPPSGALQHYLDLCMRLSEQIKYFYVNGKGRTASTNRRMIIYYHETGLPRTNRTSCKMCKKPRGDMDSLGADGKRGRTTSRVFTPVLEQQTHFDDVTALMKPTRTSPTSPYLMHKQDPVPQLTEEDIVTACMLALQSPTEQEFDQKNIDFTPINYDDFSSVPITDVKFPLGDVHNDMVSVTRRLYGLSEGESAMNEVANMPKKSVGDTARIRQLESHVDLWDNEGWSSIYCPSP